MIHENVTQTRQLFADRTQPLASTPHVSVIREDGGYVWELRKADLVAYGRSPIHYSTLTKAQAAGDRALARGFHSTI